MTHIQTIALNEARNQLTLTLQSADGSHTVNLSAEFLRVYSQSAEVTGHKPGEEKLVLGKTHVTITDIQPVGRYAIKIVFSDGHDSGIYSWTTLLDYATRKNAMWQTYQDKVATVSSTDKLNAQLNNLAVELK